MKELTFSDIQEIIRNDEGRTLEVKETTGEIVKAMCAACAFLNSDGGWLVFGVTPKLKIVGQQVTDEVIKKATINMLCHRSWEADNLTPSLAIFDDRIEFQNPGTFPAGYTWRDFAEFFNSMPQNPLIASVFYRRGLMERWGRGIGLIIKKCAEAGLPEPVFEVSHSFVTLTIKFKQLLATNGGLSGGLSGGLKLTERETQVVDILRKVSGQTIEEVATTLNLSKRTMERIFASLKQKGFIEKEGSRKNGVWKVIL